MKLLIITYSLSKKFAAGQVFSAFVESLSKQNQIKLTIVSTTEEIISKEVKHYYIPNKFLMKERLHKVLFLLTGIAFEKFFWVLKVRTKANMLVKKNGFDFVIIFSDGNTPEIINIGYLLSKKNDIPLYIHMVDPIPPPLHWGQNILYWKRLKKYVEKGLNQASLLSFGNKRMLDFQNSILQNSIEKKSFVVPDAISGSFVITGEKKDNLFVITYLGSFYGVRKPDALLKAFMLFIELGYNAELRIYGNSKIDLKSYDLSIKSIEKIKLLSFTNDIDTVIKESNVLIDIDVPFSGNVFSSSKIKKYLFYDRQILCITKSDSPSFDICKRLTKSSYTSSHKIDDIVKAFVKMKSINYDINDYNERTEIINEFKADNVANKIISELNKYDSK